MAAAFYFMTTGAYAGVFSADEESWTRTAVAVKTSTPSPARQRPPESAECEEQASGAEHR